MTRVVFRPEAEADLTAIALFIAEQNFERAKALVARLRARCRILEAHPHAGRPRPELAAGIRSLVERPYIILYRLEGDAAEIVAILHGARELPSALAARLARDAHCTPLAPAGSRSIIPRNEGAMAGELALDLGALGVAYAAGVLFLIAGYALAGPVWVERHSITLPGPAHPRRISGAWGELFLFTACTGIVVIVRFFTDVAIVRDVVLAHPYASAGVFLAVFAAVLAYSVSVVAGAKRDGADSAYRRRLASAYGAYAFYCAILFGGGLMALALLSVEFAHDQLAFNAQRAAIDATLADAARALSASDPLAAAQLALTHLEDAIGEIAISRNLLQDQMNPVFVFAAAIFAVNILIVLSPIRSAFMQGAMDLTHILTSIAIGGILIAGFLSYFFSYSQVIEDTLAAMQRVRPDAALGAWELSRRYNEMVVELNQSRNLLGFAGAIGGEGSGLALFAAAIQFTLERLPRRDGSVAGEAH